MVRTKTELKASIDSFISVLQSKIHVTKVILFGSYVNGNPRPYSDIDLAIISPDFGKMSEIEAMQVLSKQTRKADLLIEPLSFSTEEVENCQRGSFLDFILREGKVVYESEG